MDSETDMPPLVNYSSATTTQLLHQHNPPVAPPVPPSAPLATGDKLSSSPPNVNMLRSKFNRNVVLQKTADGRLRISIDKSHAAHNSRSRLADHNESMSRLAPQQSNSNTTASNTATLYVSGTVTDRRLVFVSLVGLFQSWQAVPHHLMESALVLVPLKRRWILEPHLCTQELQASLCFQVCQTSIFADGAQTNKFVAFMKWKEAQGLVVWMLDDYAHGRMEVVTDNAFGNPPVHAFWDYLNAYLKRLSYKPIETDEDRWRQGFNSMYDVTCQMVLDELYDLPMRHKTLQEMLWQSNPDLLLPLRSFVSVPNGFSAPMSAAALCADLSDVDQESDAAMAFDGAWVVSHDYDINDCPQERVEEHDDEHKMSGSSMF